MHELTTEAPHAVWLMIDRHARKPKLSYPRLEVVRASGNALVHGVETHKIETVKTKITTPAKTVADCFRCRNRVGLDTAIEAMRDYFRHKHSVNKLVSANIIASKLTASGARDATRVPALLTQI